MESLDQLVSALSGLVEQLTAQLDYPHPALETIGQIEERLKDCRAVIAAEWPKLRTDQPTNLEVGVKPYQRTINLQLVRWVCMHCGRVFEEPRPPGTFLPRYCKDCNSQIRIHRDRVRARYAATVRYNEEERERAKAAGRLPKFHEFEFKSELEEQLYNRPAQFCHHCGYDFGQADAGTASDILKKDCPQCQRQVEETGQRYLAHVSQTKQAKQHWRMPRTSATSAAPIKQPGPLATLGSGEIEERKQHEDEESS